MKDRVFNPYLPRWDYIPDGRRSGLCLRQPLQRCAEIPVITNGQQAMFTAPLTVPDGRQALYFRFSGQGAIAFYAFELVG